jgi:integrase
MAKLPSVDTAIRRLKLRPGATQTAYYDDRTPGLALIVGKKAKTWSLTYTPPGLRRKRIQFGRYPAVSLAKARERAQGVFSSLHNDVDPAAKRKAYREAPTVAEAGEKYLALYAANKASLRFDEGVIRKELVPLLGDRKLVELTRADIQTVLRGVLDRGAGIMANRTLQVLRKFLAWSVEQGWIDTNPADGISRPVAERARTRALSDEELRDLWNALPNMSRQAQAIFKLLLLTGQREMEVVRMRWSEIDFERGVWTLPPHDPGRSKARAAPHIVPLTPASVAILREFHAAVSGDSQDEPGGRRNGVPSKGQEDYVFRGRHRSGAAAGPTRGIIVAAKEDLDSEHLTFDEPWRIHDLRRTMRTGLSQLSVPPHIAELVIGHSLRGIVKVYDRYEYLTEKREALTRWADHLLIVVGEQPGASANVIPLSEARAG